MRLAMVNLIATITLALSGQAFAVEKKPCGPGEQEVMAKDRTTNVRQSLWGAARIEGQCQLSWCPIGFSFSKPDDARCLAQQNGTL